jgi:hypothetical protein
MRNWPAILLAPSLAFVNLAVTYALVLPSCERQHVFALHAVAALSLLAALACTWPSWRNWRALRGVEQGAAGEQRALFLAQVGTMVGLLSALVIAAQWLPQWMVRTCSV